MGHYQIYKCDSCKSEFKEVDVTNPYGFGAIKDLAVTFRWGDSCIENKTLEDICLCKSCSKKLYDFVSKTLNLI